MKNLPFFWENISFLKPSLKKYLKTLEKFSDIGDKVGEAMSLKMIGVVKFYQGKAQEIFPYWEKELSIHRELGNKKFEGHTLNNIGNI